MSAILANAVRTRNERYINRLGEDIGKYLSFLSVMSRFHKYPAEDLASFAMEAPATFSAVASAETWEKRFGRIIDNKAKGITLVRNNDRTYYYDVSETVPVSLGAPEVTLWQYDDSTHRPFLDAVVPGNADTEAKVSAIVAEEMKEVAARPADRRLITLSTTAVVLERMGLSSADTTRQIARLSLSGRNMHSITEETQKASRQILDAVQKSVMKGRADDADLSLPENNPLLSVFGVVTENLPEREEEPARETPEQASLFDAFGEAVQDDSANPLVGETPPPPAETEQPDVLSTEWQSEDYATDEMMAEEEVLPEDFPADHESSLKETASVNKPDGTEAVTDATATDEAGASAEPVTDAAATAEEETTAGTGEISNGEAVPETDEMPVEEEVLPELDEIPVEEEVLPEVDEMPVEEEFLPEMEEGYQQEIQNDTAAPTQTASAEPSTDIPAAETPAPQTKAATAAVSQTA